MRGARAWCAALGALLSLAAPGALRAADPPRGPSGPSAPSAAPPAQVAAPPSATAASPSATAALPSATAASPSGTAAAPAAGVGTSSLPPADPAKERRERQARALELHDEAKALYERGLYRRAIAKLEAALELDPEGKELVYNLALIHEKLVEPEIAERYYLRYIAMETDPRARERAVAIVKRLEGAKKNLHADLQERALAASASASAAPSGAPSATAAPQVRRMPSPMVFVLGGVAVAAAGVGVGFGVSALTTHPDGEATGHGTTSYDLETRAESAHTQAAVADLAFVTSVVVGAATAVLYLLETRSPSPVPSPAAPAAAPSPAAARARFRMEVPF